ncbi:MAG TPA: 16S rRNA processing protein RimM [Verrucomicrobiae bacterium]|nr:16S rRNA processing protein RimM [Verrucomicrobiae bacterium]
MSSSRQTAQRWVQVARVMRPRGNKGEVAAELFTDFPARLSSLKSIYLRKDDGEPRRVGLHNFWIDRNHPGQGVFHFEGCGSISEAGLLRGLEVLIPIEERVELPVGHYFVTDLMGCTVFELPEIPTKLASPACAAEEAPRVLGTVSDVFFPGEGVAGAPLLQVETSAGEVLIPLAVEICTRIDVAARRIEVRLPEGLKDLDVT